MLWLWDWYARNLSGTITNSVIGAPKFSAFGAPNGNRSSRFFVLNWKPRPSVFGLFKPDRNGNKPKTDYTDHQWSRSAGTLSQWPRGPRPLSSITYCIDTPLHHHLHQQHCVHHPWRRFAVYQQLILHLSRVQPWLCLQVYHRILECVCKVYHWRSFPSACHWYPRYNMFESFDRRVINPNMNDIYHPRSWLKKWTDEFRKRKNGGQFRCCDSAKLAPSSEHRDRSSFGFCFKLRSLKFRNWSAEQFSGNTGLQSESFEELQLRSKIPGTLVRGGVPDNSSENHTHSGFPGFSPGDHKTELTWWSPSIYSDKKWRKNQKQPHVGKFKKMKERNRILTLKQLKIIIIKKIIK